MNAECERPLGAVRTASATIASFFASRPTWSTRTGASSVPDGGVASAASVATRISASPDRAASAEASRRASPRSPTSEVGGMALIACLALPRSLVPLAMTRAVRPAAITLTLAPPGSSLSASMAAALAASSRVGRHVGGLHGCRGVDDEHDVAGQARRPLDERARGEERQDQHQEQLEEKQQAATEPLPRGVRLHVRDQLLPQEGGGHLRLVPPQLEQVHRHHDRQEQQAGQRERGEEAHVSPPPGGGGARRTRGPPAGCRWRSARTRHGACGRCPRGPPARRGGVPCSRRAPRGPP